MKKILYVTSNPLEYNSSANLRNTAIIKGLIENDYEVSICYLNLNHKKQYLDSGFPELNIKKRYFLPNDYKKEEEKKITTNDKKDIRTKIINIIKSIILKFTREFSIYDFNKIYIQKNNWRIFDDKFDYIISSSDPKSAHLLAEKIIKQNPNIAQKWIQYWGDPFSDDINFKSSYLKKRAKKEEKRLLKMANKIVYVSPFTLDKQQKLFPTEQNKMTFVPIPYISKINMENPKNKVYTIGYFGDYYTKNRNIDNLIKYIVKYNKNNLIIAGGTDYIIPQNDNIESYGRLPYNEIKELETKVDLLVCLCNSSGTQIPGKIYHYSATNKPILIILDGENAKEMKHYFEKYNRFYICENDVEKINKTIEQIKKEKKEYMDFDLLDCKTISKDFITK